jgi:hypothetical protein
MGIYRFRPTPRQELIGRAALVALGLLLGWVGGWLGWFGVQMMIGATEAGMTRPVGLMFPVIALAAFLLLLAVTCIAMAFLPGRDASRGPPRGFMAVSRAFDWFWAAVAGMFEGMFD